MNAGTRAASKPHSVMKKIALLPLALLLLGCFAVADDQLRNVQTELKSLGFYYGDVNGQTNAETTAAIRRYQIRNGLEVTGTLNQETLKAIGLESGKDAATKVPVAKAAPVAPAPVEKKTPPANLRHNEPVEENDRNFLRRDEANRRSPDAVAPLAPNQPMPPGDSSIVDPPAPLDAPSADFPVLFAGTPYASAPASVQQQTLRKAQSVLASRGYYRDVVDGLPGPATEEALLSYQRAQRLTLTGRLDLGTLGQLRLLPNSADTSSAAGFRAPQRAYRGIWINRGGLRFGVEFD
jgi:peptidoglycan hydrolase-like protein with peptidoglycan-binding domain